MSSPRSRAASAALTVRGVLLAALAAELLLITVWGATAPDSTRIPNTRSMRCS